MPSSDYKYSVSTVEKLFTIIRILAHSKTELSASKIANEMGEGRNTIHRFLGTLKQLGYAVQNPATKNYYLSYKFLGLTYDICQRDNLLDKLIPYARLYSMEYGMSCGIFLFNDTTVYTAHTVAAAGKSSINVNPCGRRLPAYASAPGRVLLSTFSDSEVIEYLENVTLVPYTDSTCINRELLLEKVQRTREDGFSVVISEISEGTFSIAFPVFNQAGMLAASLALMSRDDCSSIFEDVDTIKGIISGLSNALK